MITLSKTHLSKIHDHAKVCYPEECCGAILGTMDGEQKLVSEVIEMDNISDENKKRRFMIKPNEYQRVEKLASEKGVNLLGFYHSHPDHPPIPSETDLKFAWPFFSYLILAIEKGEPMQLSSHVLDLNAGSFSEEDLLVN